MSVECFKITPTVRARIEYDTDPISPVESDMLSTIYYTSSRYSLGTKCVTRDEMASIAKGIDDGTLIGTEVYAYVHSGATISTSPFSCPWDSGQSGFAVVPKERAIKEFGKKVLTKRIRENVMKVIEAEVREFDTYLRGEIYGIIIEHLVDGEWESCGSCWGFYGLDYAIEEALAMGKEQAGIDAREAAEAEFWSQRDVVTA